MKEKFLKVLREATDITVSDKHGCIGRWFRWSGDWTPVVLRGLIEES